MMAWHVPLHCGKCGRKVVIWAGPTARIARCESQKQGHTYIIIPQDADVVRF